MLIYVREAYPLYGVDLENVEDILKVFALEQGRVMHAAQYVLHRAVFQVLKQATLQLTIVYACTEKLVCMSTL